MKDCKKQDLKNVNGGNYSNFAEIIDLDNNCKNGKFVFSQLREEDWDKEGREKTCRRCSNLRCKSPNVFVCGDS